MLHLVYCVEIIGFVGSRCICVWCLFQSMSHRHGPWMFPLECIGAKLWRHGMIRLFQGARLSCQALVRWSQSVFLPMLTVFKLFYQTAYVKHIMAEYIKGVMPDMSGYGVRKVSHFQIPSWPKRPHMNISSKSSKIKIGPRDNYYLWILADLNNLKLFQHVIVS